MSAAITEQSVDPNYNQPYIALREERAEPAPHIYVHGGFNNTDARFSFYFPAKARYQGRFFHNTYPMALSSDVGPFPIQFDVAIGDLGFCFDSGAYYVQTNLGGADRAPTADPAIGAYRVNAAAAKFSRELARELYGEHRAYGYLFGGSGGSYQVIGAAENTDGVWDGFLPYVLGSSNSIPSMFTVRMHALRILHKRDRLPAIMDAIEPGGGGDPYSALNDEERAALQEATRLGFPPRGWWSHQSMTSGYYANVAPITPMLDPTYVEDFWSKPGFLGHDDPTLKTERFTFETRIARTLPGFIHYVDLEAVPERDFADAHLAILSGEAEGKSIPIAEIDGARIGFALAADQTAIAALKPGDRVMIDNAWPLAMQTYQRHQVPTPDLYGWSQFRDAQGEPLYPQRGPMIGVMAAYGTAGSVPCGAIHGKMLALQCLLDIDAFPWQADWYRAKVREALGPSFEDNFALWFIDHAQHDNPLNVQARAHVVSYAGALQQGLRDLSAWVERGVRPCDTRYDVRDAQVHVPARASEREGVQPVVALKANGGVRAEIRTGESLDFTALIETPPGAGKIIAAEWDFEGAGDFALAERIEAPSESLSLERRCVFTKPGLYFPVLRATAQREGDAQTLYGRVQNLGRARVVVR